MSATHLAIAKLLEDRNASKQLIEQAYEKAVEFAENSGSLSCTVCIQTQSIFCDTKKISSYEIEEISRVVFRSLRSHLFNNALHSRRRVSSHPAEE